MSASSIASRALEQGKGILRLAPNWVPRSFCVPGRRIKLHPADYYAFGGDRGGIDERWFSSTTPADNGPKTSQDEGLSFVVVEDGAPRGEGHAARRHRGAEGADHRGPHLERAPGAGRCIPSSSTTRAPCPTTCTSATSTRSWWA